jgi:hypothetical protein
MKREGRGIKRNDGETRGKIEKERERVIERERESEREKEK